MASAAPSTVFPPPPPWFIEFTNDRDTANLPPPPIPTEAYPLYGGGQGNPKLMGTSASRIPSLDPDDLCFEEPFNADGTIDQSINYKAIMKDLLEELKQAILLFIDLLSIEGHPCDAKPNSVLNKIKRICQNIGLILNRFREWEGLVNICRTLDDAHAKRERAITYCDLVINRINRFDPSL